MDWNQSHFVSDVFVVDGDKSCESVEKEAEPLFSYDWEGLKTYYFDKRKNNEPTFVSSYQNGKNQATNEMADAGFPMIQMSQFNGKRICGKMMKSNYVNSK